LAFGGHDVAEVKLLDQAFFFVVFAAFAGSRRGTGSFLLREL
jgi:hypothetical protein